MRKLKASKNGFEGLILQNRELSKQRIMLGVPSTGLVRFEWHMARLCQIIPCNWGHNDCTPMTPAPLGFLVAEARNIIVNAFIKGNYEWLFFLDHDVILPQDAFVKLNNWMQDYGPKKPGGKPKYPVICGLYFAKASTPEPLIYRGRGNSYFKHWKMGDKVMVDGVPMGCTLIHRSLMEAIWKDAPEYNIPGAGVVRRVFDTPAGTFVDKETNSLHGFSGTEDLAWCNRIMAGKYFTKAGMPHLQDEKHPFLMDTSLFCWHITEGGQRYPLTVPKCHAPTTKPAFIR